MKTWLKQRDVASADCLEKSELQMRVSQVVMSKQRPARMVAMDVHSMLSELRAVEDTADRRLLTRAIYEIQMREWEADREWRGMAHHLVKEVHSMFINAFDRVLAKPGVDAAGFSKVNNNLHDHHQN
jgi:hypothetical protein